MAEQIAHMVARLMTAEELLISDFPNKSTELVRGVLLVREPPGGRHGHLSARLAFLLGQHVYATNAGMLFGQDTGFLIGRDPDTVRAPDVAFVASDKTDEVGDGYVPFAPDLAIEILSPGDRESEVLEKVSDWLAAGTRLVWVIDERRAIAQVHRYDGSMDVLGIAGQLNGENVLPGFQCALRQVLR